jgi:hypothetical protein
MIKCNHYKIKDTDTEFLAYGEDLGMSDIFELLHENIDPSHDEFRNLELLNAEDIHLRAFGRRTCDKVLEDAGIRTFNDLSYAYFLIKTKELKKSRRVREYVEQKYSQVIELVNNEQREDTRSNEDNRGVSSEGEEFDLDGRDSDHLYDSVAD